VAASSVPSFSSLLSTNEVIPKGPDVKQPGSGFGGFRDTMAKAAAKKSNGGGAPGLGGENDNDNDSLTSDELNRDPQDMDRERKKSAEDVRMEEELAAEISRVKLKRSHSTTSLHGKSDSPATPPSSNSFAGAMTMFKPSSQISGGAATLKEPETPAKKRRGSSDADVKSPSAHGPARGLSYGGPAERGEPRYEEMVGVPTAIMDEDEL